MNIQYIGLEGAKLEGYIKDSEQVVRDLISIIKENPGKISESITDPYTEVYYYPELHIGPKTTEDADISTDCYVSIDSVYENGIVFNFEIKGDEEAGKYNILTNAKLIIKYGEEPKYIISAVDARVNRELVSATSYRAAINEEIIAKSISKLGKRIDAPLYVGIRKDNIFTEKRNNKKRQLFNQKLELLLIQMCENLEKSINHTNSVKK